MKIIYAGGGLRRTSNVKLILQVPEIAPYSHPQWIYTQQPAKGLIH